MSRYWREAGSVVTALDLSAMLARRSVTTPRSIICWAISRRCRCRTPASIWRGAIWRCSGATICAPLGELYRVVRPGGRVAFSTLLADSLPELNQAWQAIDDRPHANRFLSEAAVRAALAACARPARCIRSACRSPMR
jgi:malonyl-CoA O-methyltransferase